MSIRNLFRKKKDPGDIRLFFKFNDSNVVHCNNISKEIHTKQKYYHEMYCDEPFSYRAGVYNGVYNNGILDVSDITIYIAVTYTGTKMDSLSDTVMGKETDFLASRYPFFYYDSDSFAVYLKDILKFCTDIHVEIDHKDGKPQTKYVFHCADNEYGLDAYLTLYSESVDYDVKAYLLNPEWLY